MSFCEPACPSPSNIRISGFPWRTARRLIQPHTCTLISLTVLSILTVPQPSMHPSKSTSSRLVTLFSSLISCTVSLSAPCPASIKPMFFRITLLRLLVSSTPNSSTITSHQRSPAAGCPAPSLVKRLNASSEGHSCRRLSLSTSSPSSLARQTSSDSVATSRKAAGCKSLPTLLF